MLPKAFTNHHTVWVESEGRAHPERFALDGDRIVCFADGVLAAVADGAPVTATVHEIAGGPPLASIGATARVVVAESVSAGAVMELLDHVPLGRSGAEVEASLARHRRRRMLALS